MNTLRKYLCLSALAAGLSAQAFAADVGTTSDPLQTSSGLKYVDEQQRQKKCRDTYRSCVAGVDASYDQCKFFCFATEADSSCLSDCQVKHGNDDLACEAALNMCLAGG